MHPQFVCIGSQKAGTDWLYDQFADHRDFWMPPIKEIAFFDKGFGAPRRKMAERRLNWKIEKHGLGRSDFTYDIAFLLRILHSKPRPRQHDFSAYFALFDTKPGPSGDCTPGYCRVDDEMAAEMMRQMPDTKFLLLLRDPAERLWSQAQMHTRLDFEPGTCPTASVAEFSAFAMASHIRNFSFMSQTIRRWRAVDTDNRFEVFFFDDLVSDAEGYRDRIAAFIGADPAGFGLPAGHNRKAAQPGKKPMPEDMRQWAARFFEQEYAELADLVGGPAVRWRDRNAARLSAQSAQRTAAE